MAKVKSEPKRKVSMQVDYETWEQLKAFQEKDELITLSAAIRKLLRSAG